MEWISNWIQGIIVTVIIGTIIEMILPEGNSKKYIKVVIGVYVLFSIISPIVTKITKRDFKVANILDLDQYIEVTSSNNIYENLNESQEEQIKSIYENNLKQDIKEKVATKGYEVLEVQLKTATSEEYTLETISLNVRKEEKKKEKEQNTNQIEKVEEIQIGISAENELEKKAETKKSITEKEKQELKEYLSNVYELKKENININ